MAGGCTGVTKGVWRPEEDAVVGLLQSGYGFPRPKLGGQDMLNYLASPLFRVPSSPRACLCIHHHDRSREGALSEPMGSIPVLCSRSFVTVKSSCWFLLLPCPPSTNTPFLAMVSPSMAQLCKSSVQNVAHGGLIPQIDWLFSPGIIYLPMVPPACPSESP